MVHSKILLNDGTSAVLLNDGTSYAILNEEGPAEPTSKVLLNDGTSAVLLNIGDFLLLNQHGVVPPPPPPATVQVKRSISHVTLDAGVDLKRVEQRRRLRSRYSQELMLTTEIETRARFIMPLTTTIKTTKTMFETMESKFRTRAKFLINLIQQKRTVVTKFDPISVRIPTKAKFSFDKIINTLKDYLDIDK